MTEASNDAYAEFRRQMLSQVNTNKSKRKIIDENGNSRPNSANCDSDYGTVHGNFIIYSFVLLEDYFDQLLVNRSQWTIATCLKRLTFAEPFL